MRLRPRASLNVTWKDRKEVVADLKPIYKAATADEAERQLSDFEEKWKKKYPAVSRLWREHWERVIPFFALPAEVRKIVYTTNAVEPLMAKWETVQHWKQMLNCLDTLVVTGSAKPAG